MTLRLLSERLARGGAGVLRFDYDATGDSAGDKRDGGRVAAWTSSVLEGARFLRQVTAAPLVVVGMGLGATLAVLAADELDMDGVVLWDPYSTGRGFLTEQKALLAISLGSEPAPIEGLVQLPEVAVPVGDAAEIRQLDLGKTSGPVAKRVLVLTRPEAPRGRLEARLDMPHVDWAEASDQEELLETGSAYGAVAYASLERVLIWVSHSYASEPLPWQVPATPEAVEVPVPGAPAKVRERALRLGRANLFGIVTEPLGEAKGPTALFVNTAHGAHSGVDRLWVELARQWAAMGLRCVRMDMSGLGDSPLRNPAQARNVTCAAEALDDVTEACRALEPEDPSNVALVGLCTGGYQVLESAMELRPRLVVAVNPEMSFPAPERLAGKPLDPRRHILLPRWGLIRAYYTSHYQASSPTRVLDRRVNLGRLLRAVAAPSSKAAMRAREMERQLVNSVAWRLKMLARPSRRPQVWLGSLLKGGTQVVLVTCDVDARPLRTGVPANAFKEWEGKALQPITISDHMMRSPRERQMVVDAITERLAATYDLGPSPAAGKSAPSPS
jgi:dienelactone hydrolase